MWLKPKIDASCPDHYVVKVDFVTGKTKEYNVVSQSTFTELLELRTTDDTIVIIPRSSIESVEFDKAFTRMLEKSNERRIKETRP